jgi:hypothetical protein
MGSQAFDTGRTLPQRTELRNALVAKLSPLLLANGLYLLAVGKLAKAWTGEHDEQGLVLINQALQGRYPSMLVALGDASFKPVSIDGLIYRGEVSVHVYVASANPRGYDDGRLSPDVTSNADVHADPGIDAMLEHARQLLVGQDLGVNSAEEPRLHGEQHVFTGEVFSCWEETFLVKLEVVINPDRSIVELVSSIDTKTLTPTDVANPQVTIVETVTELDPEEP